MTGVTTPPAAGPEDQISADNREEWPDWLIDRTTRATTAELARYVSVAHAANWVPTDLRSPLRSEGAIGSQTAIGQCRDRAAWLFEALAARRIPYASAPWNPAAYDPEGRPAYQRIRTPAETIQGPATCLDLALTFAGMVVEADLRPLIAFRYQPTLHALIVLEVGGGISGRTDYASWPTPPGFVPRPGEPGVWDQDVDEPLVRLAEDSRWLPVDVVSATRDFGFDFEKASGWTMAQEEDSVDSVWVLVDVRRVLADLDAAGIAPFEPPRGRSVPPIHGYLPALPGFREFSTRSGILRGLQDRIQDLIYTGKYATLVIQAPSGYGKSMLAHRLATGADNGCGWFLNATDARELTRSLAQAERSEHELGGEQPRPGGEKADAVDDRAFAAAALERLRTAERPWVVVVDNCDSPPETPGLADLLPKPHAAGQVVIMTTTHPGWLARTADARHRVKLNGLSAGDLRDLRLPAGLSAAVGGRPLIALALAALRDHGGVELPADSGQDGPDLVWDLLRGSARAGDEVVELAQLLAWLPPEPMPEQALCKIAAWDASPGDTLANLGFVTWSAAAVPGLPTDPAAAGGLGLLMHRLFAAAVREQIWRDDPDAAAGSIARLLTTDEGRWLFITAADATALARLEHGDHPDKPGELGETELAVRQLTDRPWPGGPAAGLLWYGLGHIRERRGPVPASREPFARAAEILHPDSYPYQVAESRIGLARVIFHDSRSADALLETAREMAREAQGLLAPLSAPDARQLREQGNALSWLIERRLAGHEPDLVRRQARLTEVRDNLWSSFAERLRIARGLGDDALIGENAVPELNDGLGPERAFFNLAGTDVQLAKTRHELARRAAAAAGRELRAGDELLEPAERSLREAGRVYDAVRELREKRYGGRPHPHLAACLHGLAIVEYYRAALLGQVGELAGAAGHAAAALDQRLQIVGSLNGPGTAAVLRDPDVRKSADLLLKIMMAAVLGRFSDPASGHAEVVKVFREATREWLQGPGRMPAEPAEGRSAMLGFEHEAHVELPPDVLAGVDSRAARALIQEMLTQIGPLARVAPDIEVIRIRPPEPGAASAAGSLDVGLALPAPVSKQMDMALRWTIANAIQNPDPSWSPEPGPPQEASASPPAPAPPPAPGAAPPSAPEAATLPACLLPQETAPPLHIPERPVVTGRPTPPASSGFAETQPRKPRPRYLSASYPDTVRPGQRFPLEATVALSHGTGRSETEISGLHVPPRGKRLLLTIYASELTVHGDHQQHVNVPVDADSAPVLFELEGTTTGVQRIRLRAWDGGTCVGELWAEVAIDGRAIGGPSSTSRSEMEPGAVSGEITLEVSLDTTNGWNRYCFRLWDPVSPHPPAYLPLRDNPAEDIEALIRRLDALAENRSRSTAAQLMRDLRHEGIQLWQALLPPSVQQQFWGCRDRIAQGQLTILADNDVVPWELLYPYDEANDEGFLVQQFPVTRRVYGWPRPRLLRRRPARFVLPDSAPEWAEDEINVLRQLMDAQEPTISRLEELQELIESGGFGLLHFACHGSINRDHNGPQIHLDQPFVLRDLVAPRHKWQDPLIFLNACRSAEPGRCYTMLDSFAQRFIKAGAGAFIGSLWEVRDGTAPEFAKELYTSLKDDHLALGDAVTNLRKRVQDDGDPTWLAYAVYGDPQAKLA